MTIKILNCILFCAVQFKKVVRLAFVIDISKVDYTIIL